MKHPMLIAILVIVSVLVIGTFISTQHLFWTGGNMLGCSDCHLITRIGPQTISSHFTCPSSWSGVDYFAGCIVNTYTTFALRPGESANVCGSDSYCSAVVEYWGKCNPRYTSEYKCDGDVLYRGYITTSCAHTFYKVKDCNSLDGCKGTTYYDYYCSGSGCAYKTYPNDPRCAKPSGAINLKYVGVIAGGLSILGVIIYLLLR